MHQCVEVIGDYLVESRRVLTNIVLLTNRSMVAALLVFGALAPQLLLGASSFHLKPGLS